MGEVEVAREEVLQMLPELSEIQLGEVVTSLTLTVKDPKSKASMKSVLLNTIRRYITSEEVEDKDDQGLAMLGRLHDDLEQKLSIKLSIKENQETENLESTERNELEAKLVKMKEDIRAKVESGGSGSQGFNITKEALEELWNRTDENMDTRLKALLDKPPVPTKSEGYPKVDLHKFKIKEFKINGTVGGENEIDYSGLMYQVKEGRKLGYSEEEIQLGIVKVIKDKTLKKFFEICTDMSSDDFYGMLKNHYDVKDSTTLLEDMVSSVQEPTESMLNFVMRMFNTRNTILQVTQDEDCPLGEPIIQKQFVRSVLVGLRKPTNRLELQPLFERKDLTDMELLKQVKEIMKKDDENAKKMGKSGKGGVNFVDAELKELSVRKKDGKVVEDAILEQISNLTAPLTAQMQAFATSLELLQEELKKVKRLVAKNDYKGEKEENGTEEDNASKNKKFVKCKKCEKSGAFCRHCSVCGSGEHKRRECPKNK